MHPRPLAQNLGTAVGVALGAAVTVYVWRRYLRKILLPNRQMCILMKIKALPAVKRLKGKSILSIKNITKEDTLSILEAAAAFKVLSRDGTRHTLDLLKGKLLTTFFCEPSTRTRCSFECAMQRLGGDVIGMNQPALSSVAKGETLADTLRMLSGYSDAIVIRHPLSGALAEAAVASSVPLINAGDGCGEHPTQALLDLFTIVEHFPHILQQDPQATVVVSIVGDLLHGRTVHSLAMLLARYDVRLNFVAVEPLQFPADMEQELYDIFTKNGRSPNGRCARFSTIKEVIGSTDVLYMTRIQKERLPESYDYNDVKSSNVLTTEMYSTAPDTLIVMHPLPRIDEIPVEADVDPRSVYFQQAANGLFVRMALLWFVLGC